MAEKKGSTQWSFLLTGEEDAEISAYVDAGHFYKVILDKELVAVFLLSKKPTEWDIHLWGGSEYDDRTIYLHKLAVSLAYKGGQVGDFIMNWIKEFAAQHGVETIRLDCVADSVKLNSFYQSHGFQLIKIYNDHCLYERYFL